jgi:uncharacterized repeat protein (TIGR01451 family)
VIHAAVEGGTRRLLLLALGVPLAAHAPAWAASCARPNLIGPRAFEADDSSFGLAVGDFDADGSKDVAVANLGGGTVSVLLGDGDAGFAAPVQYDVGEAPRSVAVADVNRDAKEDLLVGNTNSLDVSMLLGNGDGTFQAAVPIPGSTGYAVVVADLNGDQNPDLATANFNSAAPVRLGNGDGTWQDAVAATVTVGGNATALAVADMNEDLVPDLVVSLAANGNAVWVLLGNGNGTFQAGVGYPAATTPWALAVGDLNGDLHQDVVVVDNVTASAKVVVLLGNGAGALAAPVAYDVGPSPNAVALADFDGDGDLDVVAGVVGLPGALWVLRGNGDGTLQAAVPYRRTTPVTGVAVSDFDGDAKVDLAFTNGQHPGANLGLLLGNGDGTFQIDRYYPTEAIPQDVAVTDFNRDGNPDVVVANSGGTTATVRLGAGDGTLLAPNHYPVGSNPSDVAVGDFNGDSNPDFVTANLGSSNVTVRLGNGNGTFQAPVNYSTIFGALGVSTGDVNGDGKLDLVVLPFVGVYVLRGNGDGTFQEAVQHGSQTGQGNVALGDLNGDQKLDLVGPSLGADAVWIARGNGDGTFQASVDVPTGAIAPRSVAIGDFDADGARNLAVANFGCNPCGTAGVGSVSILLGNGNGTFEAPATYSTAAQASQFVAAGDLSGDGRDDLAVVNFLPWTLSVLFSNPDGTFQPALAYGTQYDASSVALADFDGDGGTDLAVTNRTSNDVSIFRNRCTGGIGPSDAELAISKEGSPDPVTVGGTVTYTIEVTHNGLAEATNVVVTDELPPNVTFVSASAGCGEVAGTVSCALGSLASGGTAEVTITVTADEPGAITNTARVDADQFDPVAANDAATDVTTAAPESCADLAGAYAKVRSKCKTRKDVTTCALRGVLTVQNAGNTPSAASVVRVYFSTDATLDDADVLLRERPVKPTKTGKARKAKFKGKLEPGVLTTGGFVIASLDATAANLECDEGNNTVVSDALP